MDRRLAGVLIVVLAVLAVTVAAVTPGRRLAGTATPMALPAMPSVGECLIDPTDSRRPARTDGRQPPQFGSCTDDLAIGEVVAVRVGSLDRRGVVDPTGCRPAALARAGLQDTDGAYRPVGSAWAGDPVRWSYSIDVITNWLPQIPWLPSGSAWAACVATPTDGRLGGGFLWGAFSGGTLPGDYGTCWQSRDVDAGMQVVNCNLPHVAELVALGTIADGSSVSANAVASSCAKQAARVLDRNDPTAGGLLEPTVRPTITGVANQSVDHQTVDLVCFLTTTNDDRRLVGSLVGLGSAPPRFAG